MKPEDAKHLNEVRLNQIREAGCATCSETLGIPDHYERYPDISGTWAINLRFTCSNGHRSYARLPFEIGRYPGYSRINPMTGTAWMTACIAAACY